jgi:Phytochelatin synthase
MRRQARALRRRLKTWVIEHGWRPPRRQLPLPGHLVALPSTEGVRLLAEADPREDYLRLGPWYETQESPNFCGPATMAMLLNMLGVQARSDGPARFTQHTVFTPATDELRPRDAVIRDGMSLPAFAEYLGAHGVSADLRFADEVGLDGFRESAVAALGDPSRGIAVNYLRTALDQEGGGHTSPLAAFHAPSDRFLVLDVSRYRYPPVWVRAADLFRAMDTPAGRRRRGYVVASL